MPRDAPQCRDAVVAALQAGSYSAVISDVISAYAVHQDRDAYPVGTHRVFVGTGGELSLPQTDTLSGDRRRDLEVVPIEVTLLAGVASPNAADVDSVDAVSEELEAELRKASNATLGKFSLFKTERTLGPDPEALVKAHVAEFGFVATYLVPNAWNQ